MPDDRDGNWQDKFNYKVLRVRELQPERHQHAGRQRRQPAGQFNKKLCDEIFSNEKLSFETELFMYSYCFNALGNISFDVFKVSDIFWSYSSKTRVYYALFSISNVYIF